MVTFARYLTQLLELKNRILHLLIVVIYFYQADLYFVTHYCFR